MNEPFRNNFVQNSIQFFLLIRLSRSNVQNGDVTLKEDVKED